MTGRHRRASPAEASVLDFQSEVAAAGRGAQRRADFLRQADGAAATCGGHRAGVRRPPAQQEVLALVPRNRISRFDSPCWLSHLNFI